MSSPARSCDPTLCNVSSTTTRRYNAPAHPAAQLLRCQYLHLRTSNASNLPSTWRASAGERIVGHALRGKRQPSDARQSQQRHKLLLRRQYLYFCTSEASERFCRQSQQRHKLTRAPHCQYLYFCTSKASKLSTSQGSVRRLCDKLSERKCTSCFNPRPRSTLSWFPCTHTHTQKHTHTHTQTQTQTHTHASAYLNTRAAFFFRKKA